MAWGFSAMAGSGNYAKGGRSRVLFCVRTEVAMQHEKILTTIVSANPTSRLEVAMCMEAQGERTLELRRLSWGDGVGWYCQQTLRLDPHEAESLFWALRGNQRQWRDRSATGQGKIIPLPITRMNQGGENVSFPGKAQKMRPGSRSPLLPGPEKGKAKQGSRKSATSRV